MNCYLCGKHRRIPQPTTYTRPPDHYTANGIPEPVIHRNPIRNAIPGHFPGNRAPMLTDAYGGHRSGMPSYGLDQYAPTPITMKSPVGPTDIVNRFTRTQAEGGAIRWVREKYVIPGGPAGAAQGLYGPIHNYGYLTIADTLKPAQQLPRYNLAAVDPNNLVSRARATLLRTLYGVTP